MHDGLILGVDIGGRGCRAILADLRAIQGSKNSGHGGISLIG